MAPNAVHSPKFKAKIWDGKIRLYKFQDKTLYYGLLNHVKLFCEERGYQCNVHFDDATIPFSIKEAEDFLKTLHLPEGIEARDYQLATIAHCIREKRLLALSAVNSGKSLAIYSLIRYFNCKIMLIVPSKALVEQMYKDFAYYSSLDDGWNVQDECSRVYEGFEKTNLNGIVITTWQSAINQTKRWFQGYEAVLVDEAHEAKGASIRKIMDVLEDAHIRLGFTGTIDEVDLHELVLTGLFGPIKTFIRTREMIDRQFSSDLTLKVIVFSYEDEVRQHFAKKANKEYTTEVAFLIGNEERNNFIANLAQSLPGNVLVFYNYVDKHGKILYDKILERNDKNKNVHFVYGDVKVDVREQIREDTEASRNNIIVASYGTYSRGINIVNLDYMIFAFPSKSKVRNLQSIGRGLRRGKEKDHVTLFDLADDFRHHERKNHTYTHLEKRLKIYAKEGLKYKIYKAKLPTKV